MIIRNEYILKVDLKKYTTSIVPIFVQYDAASLIFKVYDNGEILDLTNFSETEIAHCRPDGTTIIGNGEIITLPNGDAAIKYKYLGSEMNQLGNVSTSLSLFSEKKKVSILPFNVKIVKDIRDGFISAPTEEVGYLQQLIVEVKEVLNDAVENNKVVEKLLEDIQGKVDIVDAVVLKENERQANEIIRVASENERNDAEATRLSEEQVRQSNEDSRVSSENDRLSEEELRKANELIRIANENERIVNEPARIEAEKERIDFEIDRKSSESDRKTSETSRINAETDRLSNEDARITAETDRLSMELLRKADETVRKENEDIRIAKETARQSEENKRLSAESARVSDMNNRIHKGAYSPSANYMKHNEVNYNGSSWRCLIDNKGQIPVEGQYWTLVAQRGTDGKGSVASVNGAMPDASGNVELFAINIGAAPLDHTHEELHSHTNKNVLDALTSDQGKLKYNGQEVGSVTSVNGQTGEVTVTKEQVGLGNVDDTSDLEKPISTATQDALDSKISNSEKGIPEGVALLNADGKVVDADGNLVEGKVTSVNGRIGDVEIGEIVQQDTPPDGIHEGRLWLDTSEHTHQGTVFEEFKNRIDEVDKQSIKSINGNILPDDRGNINITIEDNNVTQLASYQYVLETTESSQESWKIPLETFNPLKDTIIVIRNTSTLSPTMYTIDELVDGYYVRLTIPAIELPKDNNVGVIILKNVRVDVDETIDGKLLTEASVTINKLSNEIKVLLAKASDSANQQDLTDLDNSFSLHHNLIASITDLGHVKVDGTTITIDSDGTLHGSTTYQLPIASTQILGGIKVDGSTITIDGNGIVKANFQSGIDTLTQNVNTHKSTIASSTVLGHIKVGQNLTIGADGTLNATASTVPDASTSRKGIVQLETAVNSTSMTNAATPSAVKSVYDKINASDLALGYGSAAGTAGTAIGGGTNTTGGNYGIAIGFGALAKQNHSVAIGYNVSAGMHSDAKLGVSTNGTGPWNWLIPGQLYVSGTKNFQIAHPKPEKKATHVIRHGAVESPTTGDTLYRYTIEASSDNQVVEIQLPDYFEHLNINVDVWVNPHLHFGRAYGVVEGDKLKVTCETVGQYKALIIGTRNDDDVQDWYIKGVEREIGETWTGETYEFEVTEFTEIVEFKEEIQ